MKDLLKITKDSIQREKVQMPMNDQVMQEVIKEESDSDFERMKDVSEGVIGMCLNKEAKESWRVQRLKGMYKELGMSFKDAKGLDKFKVESVLEACENESEVKDTPYPSLIAQAIQAGGSLRALASNKETVERMADVEEVKGKPQTELRVSFRSKEKFVPKGINDTFLPKRWNVYDSLYKGHPKYRQGRQFEEYISLIGNGSQESDDIRERRMRIEIATMVKVQENFHHWIYNYLSNKVQELKKSLHNKSGLEKTSSHKVADDVNKAGQLRQLEGASLIDIVDELDPIVENPAKNLVCCLCKQRGERKLSGRIIPFQGLLGVHVNCAFWSTEVFETTDGALVNFYFAYKRAKGAKCNFCGKVGASLGCSSKKCHNNYHFICALSQQAAFLPSKVMYCRQCAKNKGHTAGLCTELSQKRRFYIAKNNTPFANANDMVDGMIERWKPFGYESFNRVGNLTVIHLSKKLDKILSGNHREAFLLANLDGYMSLRITWNIFDLNSLSAGLPFFASKGYYLCCGSNTRSMTVKVYARPSVNIVRPHLPPYMVLGQFEADTKEAKMIAEKDAREIQSLWLGEIKKHLPNFSLENISLSAEDFVGVNKFPIPAWHLLNTKNAEVVLCSCAQAEQVKPAAATSKRDTNASKQTHPMFVGRLKEETFDDIIGLNMEIGSKSTKYISYKRSQPSPFTGKIGVRDSSIPPSKFSRKGKVKEVATESKNSKTNIREADLPIGMKYRNYRQMAKTVEVAPSRIHKNGLFATEE
eukprot:TRINITY_DN11207_c0_g2_i11.p1 TRINITY_DN11207_c0_g2~~TRINITY_DN11207_c0_g2_i11.p1  ORF type:complete len:759 (-),score=214.09 TRINITY_DN11207_c0_g2_i11:267-2543(-)